MKHPKVDLAYLALAAVPGIGPRRLGSLVRGFGSAKQAIDASLASLDSIPGISRAAATAIKNASIDDAEKNVRSTRELGGTVLVPSYFIKGGVAGRRIPKILEQIPNPPTVLYALGDVTLLDRPAVALVGARDNTQYGRSACELLVPALANAGLVVVSGMARGVDALVHSETLAAGGKTVGVLGNGLGVVYPAANRDLYERVAERGCLVTEFPPGERPNAGSFPRRNRLISGLSRVTIVVEARARSGALITADCALDQGREVMAVPGPITSPISEGCNRLISMGAKPALTALDVLEEYGPPACEPGVGKPEHPSDSRPVVRVLRRGPSHVDQLALELEQTVTETLMELTTLELEGRVEQQPGKVFRLAW